MRVHAASKKAPTGRENPSGPDGIGQRPASDSVLAGRSWSTRRRRPDGRWRPVHRTAAVGICGLGLAMLLASCSSSTSTASSASSSSALTSTTDVTIALPIDLPPQSPVFLAQKLGYFRQNHIDATIPIVSGDVAANSALVAGSVQYTSVNAVSLFSADEKGIPLQAICMEYDGVGYALAANNAFASSHHLTSHSSPKAVFNALKGQTVATVGGPAAAPGLMLTGLLQYYGFPSNWLTDLSLSGASDLLTAVQHGQVAALFNGQPTPTEAADKGVGTVVFNTTELKGLTQLPWEGIMGLRSYVSTHPAVDRAVCRAIGEADDYLIVSVR